jgi:hypothetical protein
VLHSTGITPSVSKFTTHWPRNWTDDTVRKRYTILNAKQGKMKERRTQQMPPKQQTRKFMPPSVSVIQVCRGGSVQCHYGCCRLHWRPSWFLLQAAQSWIAAVMAMRIWHMIQHFIQRDHTNHLWTWMVALDMTSDYDSTESDTERRQQIRELRRVLNSKC